MPLFSVPHAHFAWGQQPPTLEPGWWQLFLDLCYVGIAFNIGTAVKHSFYECEPAHGSSGTHDDPYVEDHYSSNHYSPDTSHDHHRLLGDDHHLSECVGLWRGIASASVFFFVLFRC